MTIQTLSIQVTLPALAFVHFSVHICSFQMRCCQYMPFIRLFCTIISTAKMTMKRGHLLDQIYFYLYVNILLNKCKYLAKQNVYNVKISLKNVKILLKM
jgi:hypothetical protein